MFVELREGKRKGTQQGIIDSLNKKYNLCGEGRDTREKHMLALRTVQRLVGDKKIGVTPEKKGRKAVISRAFL